MLLPTTVKPASLKLTWGGSTEMPRRPHSSMYSDTLPVWPSTLESSAAMYSQG